jgi:hypothetical protein
VREKESSQVGPYVKLPDVAQRIAEYGLMARYEPTIATVLKLARMLVSNRVGGYKNNDDDVQLFVNRALDHVEGGRKGVVASLLSATWAGFACLEKVWETEVDLGVGPSSAWVFAALDMLHPLSFVDLAGRGVDGSVNGIKLSDVTRKIEELIQFPTKIGEKPVVFLREDVVYFALWPAVREDVYGCSLLECARRAWYSKTKIEQFWNTYCEKAAFPTPILAVPLGTVDDKTTGKSVTWAEWFAARFSELGPGQGVFIPSSGDFKMDLQTLAGEGDGAAYSLACTYWDDQLFRSMLFPKLLLEEPEHGSRAQAQTSLDMYLMVLEGICSEIGTALMGEVVAPLLLANFGELEDVGEWEWGSFRESDLQMLAGVFEAIERGKSASAQMGGSLSPADETKLREVFGAVYASPEEVELAGGLGERNPAPPKAVPALSGRGWREREIEDRGGA